MILKRSRDSYGDTGAFHPVGVCDRTYLHELVGKVDLVLDTSCSLSCSSVFRRSLILAPLLCEMKSWEMCGDNDVTDESKSQRR